MNCKKCGEPISEGQWFCPKCGEGIQEPENNNNRSEYIYEESEPDGMFSNVGAKIQLCAKAWFYIFVILALFNFVLSFNARGNNTDFILIFTIFQSLLIAVMGYIGALFMTGFGKIVDNVEEIKKGFKNNFKNNHYM